MVKENISKRVKVLLTLFCRHARYCALSLALLFFLVPLCPLTSPAADLKKVTFLPQWLPQAQFAGYYVAKDKGIYERHGMDVTILRGGPDAPPVEMLAKKRTDFATMFLSTAMEKRAAGGKLVNIAQVVQYSGFILVAKKSSGITSVKDLNGKKVSLWPYFELQPLAFFHKYNLRVKTIPQSSSVNLFLLGGVDVVSAMWYNEYHTILSSGLDEEEVVPFFFDKHGLNFPEDGIYCLEDTAKRDRALSCNFAKASMEGWQYAFDHPDEALDIVMKYVKEANVGTNRTHQKWMLSRMKDLIIPHDKNMPMGNLKGEEYLAVGKELLSRGIIKTLPALNAFRMICRDEY